MEHHHHHHHHHELSVPADSSVKRVYILSIVLNLGFVIAEGIIGIWSGSLGLLSDAGHNLGDVVSLLLALLALGLSVSAARKGYTYGFRKSSVLLSLTNAVLLLVAVGAIIIESIRKFYDPAEVDGAIISWTAGAGILVNGLTAMLLMRTRGHDINAKGAFLHMLADTLVSVGVVVSGLIISFTGWYVIDPIIGLTVAAVILFSTWDLLKESVRMSIDAVPEGIDCAEIESVIREAEGVKDMHHLHIWPISTTETALTAHIVVEDLALAGQTVHLLKDLLAAHGISHSTLELETDAGGCHDHSCC